MVTRGRQAGFTSLLGIAAVVLMACAVAVVLELLAMRMHELRLEERHVRLTALADAGLAESLAGLDRDPAHAGIAARSWGGGIIASRVWSEGPRSRQVEVVATWGGWSERLLATVELDSETGPRVVRWQQQGPAPAGGTPTPAAEPPPGRHP